MNEQHRRERNTIRLAQLYRPFADQVQGVIADLESAGYRPRIQEAYRSPEDQLRAFRSGNSQLRFGFHNVTRSDGTPEGLAVDLYDDDRPLNPTTGYLLRLSGAAWGRNLGTGVLWGLTQRQRQLVTNAVNAQEWSREVRLGWDAWHIEPRGLSAAQARRGARPQFSGSPRRTPALPSVEPYTVTFFDEDTTETTQMLKDRSWLPLRMWGLRTAQPVVWQGEGLPILMAGVPYGGEMQMIGETTYSPVRDLAAFSGLDLDVDTATRRIAVKRPV